VAPNREEVRQRLRDLLAGRLTREEVADWAATWVRQAEPAVHDLVVWDALKQLAGADLRSSPIDYLHTDSDFHDWLDRIEAQRET
jgi:hypothetical protein